MQNAITFDDLSPEEQAAQSAALLAEFARDELRLIARDHGRETADAVARSWAERAQAERA